MRHELDTVPILGSDHFNFLIGDLMQFCSPCFTQRFATRDDIGSNQGHVGGVFPEAGFEGSDTLADPEEHGFASI